LLQNLQERRQQGIVIVLVIMKISNEEGCNCAEWTEVVTSADTLGVYKLVNETADPVTAGYLLHFQEKLCDMDLKCYLI
jgi:hypothetical protein